MDDDYNGRRPKWKTNKIEDDKKWKTTEIEDKTNKNWDKSTVENSIVNEKKKSEKPNQVVEDKDKNKEMNVWDFRVMNISKVSLTSLENSQWVDDDIIKISLALKQKEIDKTTDKILFCESIHHPINQGIGQ